MIEDPIDERELELEEVAAARYALKTANDYHFAQIHLREQMQRELSRSAQENYNYKFALVAPWNFTLDQFGVKVPATTLPAVLGADVPQYVHDAFAYLDAQYNEEVIRAEAELSQSTVPLAEKEAEIVAAIEIWYRQFVEKTAWIMKGTLTLGGATLKLQDDNFSITWTEADYG